MFINLRKSFVLIFLLITLSSFLRAAEAKEVGPEELLTQMKSNFEGFVMLDQQKLVYAIQAVPMQPCFCGQCTFEDVAYENSLMNAIPALKPAMDALAERFKTTKVNYCFRNGKIYENEFEALSKTVKKLIEDDFAVVVKRPIRPGEIEAYYTIVGYKNNADGLVESFAMLGSSGKGIERIQSFDARSFFEHKNSWPKPERAPDKKALICGCASDLATISPADQYVSMFLVPMPPPEGFRPACCRFQ